MFKSPLKIIETLILIFLFVFTAYIVFYNLGGSSLENWDEAWYGDIIRNMMQKKEYIVLYWNKNVLLDKPPFFMWIGALFSSIIGLSEFSIRLPSALSALILITVVTYYCYQNYGIIPSLLAFSSIALNNIFIWRARSGNIDSLATLEIFLVYFLILSKNKFRYFILGILFAVIYLTKASLVFFPLVVFVIYELFFERKNFKKNLINYFIFIFVFVLIAGGWLFLGNLKAGRIFVEYYLFRSDQGAANINLADFNFSYIKYAYYSLQRRFFWVLVFGLIMAIVKIKEKKYFLLVLFSTLLLAIISFGKKDNNWYLLPLMPFWSILIAFGTYKFIHFFDKFSKLKFLVIAGVLTLSLYVSYKTYTVNIRSVMTSQTTRSQAEISKLINQITDENDKIVRLDHLYPTTIYYSNRFVYSANPEAGTNNFFLRRTDLLDWIKDGKIKWLVGKNTDIDEISKKLPVGSWKIIATESDEQIMKIQ